MFYICDNNNRCATSVEEQQPPSQRTALADEEGRSINAACMWDEGWDVSEDDDRRPSQGDPPTASAGREPSPAPSVPLHTDSGLFISMIPSLHLEIHPSGDGAVLAHESERAEGFAIDTGGGTLARISPEHASSSVVFMLGDGWRDWLRLSRQFHPAPHLVTLNTPPGAVRLWYGRMHLLPKNALLPPDANGSRSTFGEWAAALQAGAAAGIVTDAPHDDDPFPTGCMGNRRILSGTSKARPMFCKARPMFCPDDTPHSFPMQKKKTTGFDSVCRLR